MSFYLCEIIAGQKKKRGTYSRKLLTHPGGLVGADLDGERVVGREHGGDGGGGVGHADAVRHAPRRHRYRCQDLK